MADPRPLLARLLNTPGLPEIVPRLPPDVLHRVIQHFGLEDCSEFLALAAPEQLAPILDADLWRARETGADETFDAHRFGVWLEVLMEAGAAVAAEKIRGMDPELVIAGLSHHTAVFEHGAVSSYTTLDGVDVPRREMREAQIEVGGYVVEARCTSAWDAIVDLLVVLSAEHPEYFDRLMRGCVRLSNGAREADGFHNLMEDREQDLFDVASDRAARREQQGYVTPAEARAFLQAARTLQLAKTRPARSPLVSAYFRAIEPEPRVDTAPAHASEPLIDLLRDAGILTPQPRALLAGPASAPSPLLFIEAYAESHSETAAEELAYLANAVVAGSTVQARPFTLKEAGDAALATCNLGLENWPSHWRGRDLITAFQVGWAVLHRDVCQYAARHLIDVVAAIRCGDRDIQMDLVALARELSTQLREQTPWRARQAIDALMMLDAPSWAAMRALIDECPVIHAAVRATAGSCRQINADDFEFISHNGQIESIHRFIASLASRLMG